MSNTLKLVIPIVLAVAAGVLNMIAMSVSVEEIQFAVAKRKIDKGSEISADDIEAVKLPATYKDMSAFAVPYQDRAVLIGQTASVDIESGNLMLWIHPEAEKPLVEQVLKSREVYPVRVDNVATVPGLLRIGEWVSLRIQMDTTEDPEWLDNMQIVTIDEHKFNADVDSDTGKIGVIGVSPRHANQTTIKGVTAEKFFDDLNNKPNTKLLRIRHMNAPR